MHWALSRRIQITVAFSAITLVAIFLLLPADTDIQTTKTSPIHDAIPQFDSNATINDANNILAIEMYKRIEPNQNKNIFFSPLGILTVFAMMYEGADGNTAFQLESVFCLIFKSKKRCYCRKSPLDASINASLADHGVKNAV